MQALRTDVNAALKDNGSMFGQRLSKSRLRDLLIVAQVAACLVLLINSTLLLRGSQRALRVDPGFDSKHVVHLSLEMYEPAMGYSQARLLGLNRQLMEEIRAKVREMKAGEDALLRVRDQDAANSFRTATMTNLIGAVLGSCMVVVAYYQFLREGRVRL